MGMRSTEIIFHSVLLVKKNLTTITCVSAEWPQSAQDLAQLA
jgi:hypothetical protein